MNIAPTLPAGSDQRIADLLDEGMDRHVRGQRRRRRGVAIAAAAAVVASAGGFAWVTVANQSLQTRSAYCYSAANTSSRYTQVGMADEMVGPDGVSKQVATRSDRIANALDMCASAWRAGILGTKTVPTLVACIRTDNVPAIFPKDEFDLRSDVAFCDDLSLAAGE